MLGKLQDKIAIVTGATSGIGEEIAKEYELNCFKMYITL